MPVEAFSIYRGLRAVNPSPYMYFLDFGDFEIAGASPEPLITVSGRQVSTRPVAGTRPRGAAPEEDRRLADELLADEKERAEHVMLVDLGRNDLGRVCEYGSVEVDEFMVVENYSHVMHIVSSVVGRLRAGVGALDALRRVLPAGTLSGAPKVRAMEIIDELEPVKRGGYGGAIGYVTTPATSTRASTSARWWSRTGSPTSRPAAVRSPTRSRTTSTASRRRRPGRCCRRSSSRSPTGVALSAGAESRESPRHRQLRLLHLQPRPYLGELGAEVEVVRNDHATVDELLSRGYDRVVVSPGPCTPERGRDLARGRCARFRRRGIPTLGVCLGHQALVQAWGGRSSATSRCTARRPTIEHDGRTIFAGLPTPLTVGRYHSLIAAPELPTALERSAFGGEVVMAVRHRELPAEGVQFHPESVLTEPGRELLSNFLGTELTDERGTRAVHWRDRRAGRAATI